jgi:hypothetical protein
MMTMLRLLLPLLCLSQLASAQFAARQTAFYGSNNDVRLLQTADFNGDGLKDLLISDQKRLSILSKLPGDDSRYEVPFSLGTGLHLEFAVDDLDQDGDVDVVAADADEHLVWWSNPGDGTFGDPVYLDADMSGISEIVIRDFDMDGFPDIAISASDGASANRGVYVYFNLQDGTFSSKLTLTPFIGNYYYASLCSTDVDGDGLPDLAASRLSPFSKMVWFRNLGSQQFSAPVDIGNSSTHHIIPADINGDTFEDLVYFNPTKILCYRSNGDGTFQPSSILYDGSVLQDFRLTDVDQDGDQDILVARVTTANPKLLKLLNDGNGNFSVYSVPTDDMPTARLHVDDLNGDGIQDLLVVTEYEQRLLRYFNSFGSFYQFKDLGHVHEPDELISGDIDGDGDQDLILGSNGGSFTASYFNQGDGTFRMGDLLHPSTTSQGVLADLNADGFPDLLKATDPYLDILYVYPKVFLNDGTGHFPVANSVSGSQGYANHILPYDWNKDSLPDVMYTHWYAAKDIYWMKNNGDGSLSFGGSFLVNGNFTPRFLSIADVDGDGDDDLFVVYASGAPVANIRIYWYENDGANNFTDHLLHSGSGQVRDTEVFDHDLDGDPDIWFAGIGTSLVQLTNDGTGQFELTERDLGAPSFPWNILPADLDMDGDTDLAATSETGQYLGWAENLDGSLQSTQWHLLADDLPMADEVACADMDGDGKQDLVVISKDEVNIFRNLFPFPPFLTALDTGIVCLDNGTPTDPTDDLALLSFTIQAGSFWNLGDSALLSFAGNTDTLPLGQAWELTLPLADWNGDAFELFFSSLTVDSATLSLHFPNPGTCSNEMPSLSAVLDSVSCQDNGTPADPSDDFLSVVLTATQFFLGDSFLVHIPTWPALTATGAYGFPLTFSLPPGSADAGDLDILVSDLVFPGFSYPLLLPSPGTCSPVGTTATARTAPTYAFHPLPFRNELQVDIRDSGQNESYSVSLYHPGGQLVLRTTVPTGRSALPLADGLPAGPYAVVVRRLSDGTILGTGILPKIADTN